MNNSMSTNIAVPEHPLPEEIQQMERNDTVCKFCGVSYLIHNEMKALLQRVEKAEKKMLYYEGSVNREKLLKRKVEKMEMEFQKQLELMTSDLKLQEKTISDMHKEKCQDKNSLENEQRKSSKLLKKITCLSSALNLCIPSIQSQRHVLDSLRNIILHERKLSKDMLENLENTLKRTIHNMIDKSVVRNQQNETALKKLEEEYLNCQDELKRLRQVNENSHKIEEQYAVVQEELNLYKQENKTLQENNEIAEKKFMQIQIDTRNSFEKLKNDHKKEKERYEQVIENKDDDITKLNKLCNTLENVIDEKSTTEINKIAEKQEELTSLKDTVGKLQTKSEQLETQRERTITAHHKRIEELRESYCKKLESSEIICRSLQNKLENMKEVEKKTEELKYSLEQMEKQTTSLKSKHVMEIDLLVEKNRDLKEKLQQESNIKRLLMDEKDELKDKLSASKTQSTYDLHKLRMETLELKKKLESRKLNETIKGETTNKYLAEMKVLTQKLQENEKQITVLQETVRQECEERLELTKTLSDTRMRLLSSQRRDTSSLTKPHISETQANTSKFQSYIVSTPSVSVKREIASHESTGNETSIRNNIDSFRERIAVALGRTNHSR